MVAKDRRAHEMTVEDPNQDVTRGQRLTAAQNQEEQVGWPMVASDNHRGLTIAMGMRAHPNLWGVSNNVCIVMERME